MGGIVELLRSAWSVLGDEARRKFKRYLVFSIVFNASAIAFVIFTRVVTAMDHDFFGGDLLMWLSFLFAVLLALIVLIIVMLVLLIGAFKALKRDYLARAFPGEELEQAEENHWTRRDAFMLYAGLAGGVAFLPNIVVLVLDITAPADGGIFNMVTTAVWIGIAIYAVPRCCERYLSPGPRLSEDSRLPAVPGISDAANPTDRDRK